VQGVETTGRPHPSELHLGGPCVLATVLVSVRSVTSEVHGHVPVQIIFDNIDGVAFVWRDSF
jgi:hypothetical protein